MMWCGCCWRPSATQSELLATASADPAVDPKSAALTSRVPSAPQCANPCIIHCRWSGVYNATAPNPVRMGELCSALGAVMGRPSFVPVPDFALRTLLGEGAQVRGAAGLRVS